MSSETNTLYLIYDGECILCNACAKLIKIKKSVGHLEIINARSPHPLVNEVLNAGYNLNEGIIVKFNDQFYYGTDAVNLLALIGSPADIFNKINVALFKSTILSKIFYPIFKLIRTLLLRWRRTPLINTSQMLGQMIFSNDFNHLPLVFKKHYSNKSFSADAIATEGIMNVEFIKWLRPVLRLVKILPTSAGCNIPVLVDFVSNANSNLIAMDRTFKFPEHAYHLNTKIGAIKRNKIIEFIRFGFGIQMDCHYDGNNKIIIKYQHYVLKLFSMLLPLPLGPILGRVYAEEEVVSDNEFKILMQINHPLLGRLFQYDGIFTIK